MNADGQDISVVLCICAHGKSRDAEGTQEREKRIERLLFFLHVAINCLEELCSGV